MNKEFSLKELYSASLKATQNIEVGNKTFEAGESIAVFDKIQIANFKEIKSYVSARGGFENRDQVIWESTKGVSVNFDQGIFSKEQFSLMTNAKLFTISENNLAVNKRVKTESDEEGKIILEHNIMTPVFVYKIEDGSKLTYTVVDQKTLQITDTYTDVIVDYYYQYNNGYNLLITGREFYNSFFSFEGKTRVKDDITGQVKTGIIRIPKLRLQSDLSMRLGQQANPVLGSLSGVALPVGSRGNSTVMEIIFLEDDIDSEIQ